MNYTSPVLIDGGGGEQIYNRLHSQHDDKWLNWLGLYYNTFVVRVHAHASSM
jgi:hypothetical protein